MSKIQKTISAHLEGRIDLKTMGWKEIESIVQCGGTPHTARNARRKLGIVSDLYTPPAPPKEPEPNEISLLLQEWGR